MFRNTLLGRISLPGGLWPVVAVDSPPGSEVPLPVSRASWIFQWASPAPRRVQAHCMVGKYLGLIALSCSLQGLPGIGPEASRLSPEPALCALGHPLPPPFSALSSSILCPTFPSSPTRALVLGAYSWTSSALGLLSQSVCSRCGESLKKSYCVGGVGRETGEGD